MPKMAKISLSLFDSFPNTYANDIYIFERCRKNDDTYDGVGL